MQWKKNLKEEFEDAKGVIRIRKSKKDTQNCQINTKKEKGTNDFQSIVNRLLRMSCCWSMFKQ